MVLRADAVRLLLWGCTWAAWMQVMISFFYNNISLMGRATTLPEFYLEVAVATRWNATFRVSFAMEFLCLSVAKLMSLDRMSEKAGGLLSKRWTFFSRIVVAAVVVGNLAGLVGNIVAAVQFDRAAEFTSAASLYFAANNTKDGRAVFALYTAEYQRALSATAVQAYSEVAVLLFINLAFVAVGVACARHVGSALALLDAAGLGMAAGMGLRQRVVGAAIALGSLCMLGNFHCIC